MLYLASTSPRRANLLQAAGIAFRLHPPGPETDVGSRAPAAEATARARQKALKALRPQGPGHLLAVDTVVALEGRILGKPTDQTEAETMLRQLSGKIHTVHTAHCLLDLASGAVREALTMATVRCRPMNEEDGEIAAYLATGEWHGKAGAYGIQGTAADFMELVAGDLDTVIGLSVRKVRELLGEVS